MKRQQTYLIKAKNLYRHDIPNILFNENVVIILYDDFTEDLYRYIQLDNVFLIPYDLYNLNKNNDFIIEGNEIRSGSFVLKNDCTINGVCYLPEHVVDLEEIENYKAWFNDKIDDIQYDSFEDLIPYIDNIPTHCDSFDNLYARITRMRDFGQNQLADKLCNLVDNYEQEFLDVESLSIQTHDFSGTDLDIKIKLNDSVYVYKPHGYHSFLDTVTKHHFWQEDSNQLHIYRYMMSFPIPTTFFGIVNYNLCQNIHMKNSKHRRLYRLLSERLDMYAN